MKILLLDIETAPHKAYVWGLYDKGPVPIERLVEPGYILCWTAKWYGQSKVMYSDIRDGKKTMLRRIHQLVGEADVVVHYNGSSFDMPTLNASWVSIGLNPPAPYINLDLYLTVRKRFRLASNKLSYIAEHLKLGAKVNHKGMALWTGCMNNDVADWKVMKAYNIQDVALLEKLYNVLKPWVIGHPNHNLFTAKPVEVCPHCGGDHIQKRGIYHAKTQSYQRYQCMDCGSWSRAKTTMLKPEKRKSVLVGV
jgi:DNA polymerase elongation subunit (family B)/predicted RNA-binding Zn-ribbon protein involved in translation (DUF1610 family)